MGVVALSFADGARDDNNDPSTAIPTKRRS
jgi:hypothetical protein